MRGLLVVGLLCGLTSDATAGPIRDSLSRYTTQPTPVVYVNPSPGDSFIWSGLALMGGGVTIELVALSNPRRVITDYYYIGNQLFYHYEDRTNQAAFYSGLGIATIGSALFYLGLNRNSNAHRPGLTVSPDRVTVTQRVRF